MSRAAPRVVFDGTIRAGTLIDLDGLVCVERESFNAADAWTAGDFQACLEENLSGGCRPFFFAVAEKSAPAPGESYADKIAGYCLGRMQDDDAPVGALYSLAVKPAFRGQALGRLLLERVCDSLRRAGARLIRLEVRADNDAALASHTKSGFVPYGALPGFYPNPDGSRSDGLRMIRVVPAHAPQLLLTGP